MRRVLDILNFVVMASLFVAVLLVTSLSFYIGVSHLPAQNGHPPYNFFDAARALLLHSWPLVSAPQSVKPLDKALFEHFGDALILAVSLLAVVASTTAVRAKLSGIQELLLYEKFSLRAELLLRLIPFATVFPKIHLRVDGWRTSMFKNLAARKMVHYYKGADKLVIISGNYSWLFDNDWSSQLREIVKLKIPDVSDIHLLSYKSPQEVADFWAQYPVGRTCKKIFQSIQFVSDGIIVNGSVVQSGQNSLYMYLYKDTRGTTLKESVCVFYGDREARTLVKLVYEDLCRLYVSAGTSSSLRVEQSKIAGDAKYFD